MIIVTSHLYGHAKTIRFSYDNRGNRVKREIVLDQISKIKDQSADVEETFYDMVGKIGISLSHEGENKVKVSISEMGNEDICKINVCSLSGISMENLETTEPTSMIDFSQYPSGVYLLNVRIGKEMTTWKIIRK